MLINRRNALMAGKRLPYDAEVEYLESTGTQYILLPANNYDGIDIMLEPAESSTYGNIGRREGTRADSICFNTTSGWGFRAYNASTWTNDTNRSLRHATVHGTTATLDSVSYTLANGWSTVAFANHPFALFGLFRPPTQEMFSLASCKIGACALYVGSEKVYDFIPVRKGTVGYLYDRVSGKLFGNAGTGDFVLGPDVVPVEYIESSGTQYIDTGVIASNDVGVSMRVVQMSRPSSGARLIFGVFGGSNRYGLGWARSDGLFTWWNTAITTVTPTTIADVDIALNYLNSRTYSFGSLASGSISEAYNESNTEIRLLNGKSMDNGNNIYATCAALKFGNVIITKQSNIVRSFLPVRVGTDATSWEGAMMDVLTRRIYRNARTGAFTYGNDLKYPIPSE